MKAPILGLAVATAAFAGSSVYLWQQLGEARTRAAQVEETARKLNQRVAELETAREQFAQRRMETSGGFMAGNFGHGGPPPQPATESSDEKKDGGLDKPVWTMMRREPPPAMKRMMQNQMRASTKRLYADVGPKLGLGKETATKLVDLLTEQQLAKMDAMRGADDPEEASRLSEKLAQEQDQAVSDLIGPDKAMSLKEYQQTLPARMEVENLARQLEGNETALTAEQRQKLTDIFVTERARVPQPEFTEGANEEEFAKSAAAWRDDYEKRLSSEVGQVLNTDQLTAYNEIQQWQKEMRDQMPQLPPGFRGARGYRGANLMFNATAGVITATATSSAAAPATPAPAPAQKKP